MSSTSHRGSIPSQEAHRAYRDILVKQIRAMEEAAEASDFASVLEITHKIQGSAALFGYTSLGMLCREVDGCESTQDGEFLKFQVKRISDFAGNRSQ